MVGQGKENPNAKPGNPNILWYTTIMRQPDVKLVSTVTVEKIIKVRKNDDRNNCIIQ